MKNDKSKVISLVKKYRNVDKFKKGYEVGVLSLTIISGIMTAFAMFQPVNFFSIFSISLFCLSGAAYCVYTYLVLFKKFQKRKENLQNKIIELTDEDELENEILSEYNKLITLDKENVQEKQEKKSLIQELINKKNLEAKSRQKLITKLTKQKGKEHKNEIIKEVENKTIEDVNEELANNL